MPPRVYVDPAFPALLRSLRTQRGMSLRDLARTAYVAKSSLSELENGAKRPGLQMAEQLDHALGAGGQLAALVTPADLPGDDAERIRHAIDRPTRVDGATVDALAAALAAQRRLDDVLPALALLPAAGPQWSAVAALARDARGPAVPRLREVAAEWTQFLGWLRAEARHDDAAARTLIDAIRQADATGNGHLSAQARNFRGYVERQRGNPAGIVRHFSDAYQTPGASVLQRAGDAAQAAHGYALLGDHRAAARLLGEASDLLTRAEGEPPSTAYWLTPTFSRLNLGLAYVALGDTAEAAQHLRAGLAGLPADQQAAEWTLEYRRALASIP